MYVGLWLPPDATGPTAKAAVAVLEKAQLVTRVAAVSRCGVPLDAKASRRFKAIVVDVGVMQRLTGLPVEVEFAKRDLLAMHNGAVAEQFVRQELRASRRGGAGLHYWSRATGSAEVDYVAMIGSRVRPIEVKERAVGPAQKHACAPEGAAGVRPRDRLVGGPIRRASEAGPRLLSAVLRRLAGCRRRGWARG